jgi:EpsI family protein
MKYMRFFQKSYGKVLLLLVIVFPVVVVLARPPKVYDRFNLTDIPLQIGDWTGKDLKVSERAYNMLSPDDLLMRQYVNSKGEVILLYVVVSMENREAFHPPELCYDGAGAQIYDKIVKYIRLSDNNDVFSNIQVNIMHLKNKDRDELILHWYLAGKKVVANFYLQQLYLVINQILLRDTPGAMIRVSTPLVKEDTKERGLERMKEFLKELTPHLRRQLFEVS